MEMNNKEFKKNFRGYNPDEVDEFLDKIAEDYEALYKENSTFKEKLTLLDDKVDHYQRMENTIQNTLLLAQNAAEQAKINSQKESELILKNANSTAQRVIEKAQFDVMKINDEFEKTKQEFNKFRNKFRNFMTSQLNLFDDMEKDFERNYNIGHIEEEGLVGIEKGIETSGINVSHSKETFDKNSLEVEKISEVAGDETVEDEKGLDEIKNFFVKS